MWNEEELCGKDDLCPTWLRIWYQVSHRTAQNFDIVPLWLSHFHQIKCISFYRQFQSTRDKAKIGYNDKLSEVVIVTEKGSIHQVMFLIHWLTVPSCPLEEVVEHGEDGLRGQPVQLLHRRRRLRARQRPPLAQRRAGVPSVRGSFIKLSAFESKFDITNLYRVTQKNC